MGGHGMLCKGSIGAPRYEFTSTFEDCYSHAHIICWRLHRDNPKIAYAYGRAKIIINSRVWVVVTIQGLLVKKSFWFHHLWQTDPDKTTQVCRSTDINFSVGISESYVNASQQVNNPIVYFVFPSVSNQRPPIPCLFSLFLMFKVENLTK